MCLERVKIFQKGLVWWGIFVESMKTTIHVNCTTRFIQNMKDKFATIYKTEFTVPTVGVN